MDTRDVDVAIVGGGSAGLSARREVQVRGKRFLIIDSGPLGTTCARVGCMPSKLLVAAADAMQHVREAGRFGVRVPEGVRVDGKAVLARVRAERDRFTGVVLRAIDELGDERFVSGEARFVGPTELEVGGRLRVRAGAVVLATGSRPWIPPALEAVRADVMVNDDVFELEDIPESVAVFGTGIIALELGQALARLGARVAFFNPFEDLGPLRDPVVRAEARAILGEELELHLGAADLSVERAPGGGFVVRHEEAGAPREARFEKILAATGRRPNLERLDLAAAGIETGPRGVPAFDPRTMQIGDRPVFLAGDVSGYRPLLHEATDEGRIAGANAAVFPEVRAHARRAPLAVVFTDPQMATVGQPFSELDPDAIVTGEVSYRGQGRARIMGHDRGHVRVYAGRERGALLGAELLGPGVEHTAHLLAWAVQQRLAVDELLRMPFYHPVVEEGIRTALRDAAAKLQLAPRPCAFELDCGPGA